VDADRKAVFSGDVQARSTEMNTSAESIQLFLLPAGGASGNQLDRLIAQGDVKVQQPAAKPAAVSSPIPRRKQAGHDREPGQPAHHRRRRPGQVTGDSLTFYIHDDRCW